MLNLDQTRLIVNLDDLRNDHRELANDILKNPIELVPACEAGLLSAVRVANEGGKMNLDGKVFTVGFSGSFGDHHVSPRTLKASHLSKMVSLEAIVTRCCLVRPKMVKSVHYCAATNIFHTREYRDATTAGHLPPTTSILPVEDENQNRLEMTKKKELRDLQPI